MIHVVGIQVEKIQSYIFQRLDDLRSGMQNDAKALTTIVDASENVSANIMSEIVSGYAIDKKILKASGKIIFVTSLSEKDCSDIFKKLFEWAYIKYDGNVFLNYVFKEYDNLNEMEIISEITKEFKGNKAKNTVIRENRELLFSFTELNESDIGRNLKEVNSVFAKNLDDLVTENAPNKVESTNGKIAVVKADIDGLGETFANIKEYENYNKLSKILDGIINNDSFAERVKTGNDLQGKIFPFYVAGDDIFYAVTIDGMLDSVEIIKNMISEINDEIERLDKVKKMSISIGVSFVNNHMPLRYYRDMVEKELLKIKKCMIHKNKNEFKSILGLSISGNCFFVYAKSDQERIDAFSKLKDEVNVLNWIRNKKVDVGSYLNKMLLALENSNSDTEKFNMALYWLLPFIQNSTESKLESMMKYYFLSHLLTGKKPCEPLFDEKKVSKCLIPKLKLLLILTDKRYIGKVSEPVSNCLTEVRTEKFCKEFKSAMFDEPIRHLYEKNKGYIKTFEEESSKEHKLRNIKPSTFIRAKKPVKQGEEGSSEEHKLRDIKPSTFIRAKKLVEQGKEELIGELLINNNNKGESISNNSKREHKYEKKVKSLLQKCSSYNWLDPLILIYKYSNEKMKFEQYGSHSGYFDDIIECMEGKNVHD